MHGGRVKGDKMKSKKEVIQDLLNTIEHELKLFIDSIQIDLKSVEISSTNLSSVGLSWLIHYSKNVLPTQKYEILNLGFIDDENFYGSLMRKLYTVKESLSLSCDDRLNKVYSDCVDFNLFFINSHCIKLFKDKCTKLKFDIEVIGDNIQKDNKKEKEKDDLFEFYLKNIDVLLMIENVLRVIDNKISSHNLESDFEKELKVILKDALNIFDYSDNNKILLAVDFTKFDMVEEFSIDVEDYFDDDIEQLIENKELLQFISNFIKTFEANLGTNVKNYQNNNYLKALKLYDLEKKLINKDIEINELKSKLSDLSMIDKKITSKNEFYDRRIKNLIRVEKGFVNILDYYNKLSQNDFTGKEWKRVNEIRSNIDYIVNIFKKKDNYKFFLLLDDSYVDALIRYFDFKTIDDKSIEWEDEISQKLIVDFHKKTVNPDTFIKLKHEDWNTPLFRFNVNHYGLIKDYQGKIDELNSYINKIKYTLQERDEDFKKNLEGNSKRIEEQLHSNFEILIETMKKNIEKNSLEIEENGALNLKVKDYILNLENYNNKYYTQATNILSSNKVVKEVVDDIRRSKSFIEEIEGLYINNETRKVYETVFCEELKIANNFRNTSLLIYGVLGVVAFISLFIILFVSTSSDYFTRLTEIDTLLVKLSLILTLVFIGVYLSREGEKHRRIANQARQTMNELHAFSSYSTDIKDKIPEIKTKLADKYFGKTLYETEKAMTPDSDVLKSVIDQAKATTDLVKAFKGTITPDTSSQDSGKNKSNLDQNG